MIDLICLKKITASIETIQDDIKVLNNVYCEHVSRQQQYISVLTKQTVTTVRIYKYTNEVNIYFHINIMYFPVENYPKRSFTLIWYIVNS